MKKIILTGGKGFFCTRLAKYYKGEYEILSLGKDQLDITQRERVLAILKEFKPDYVIHAAAVAVTDFCNQNPKIAHKINVDGSINVALACKEVSAKTIFISSEQVFNGNKENGPYDEDSKPVPDTVYGQNKLEAEGALKDILDELWILRFSWMFGLPKEGFGITSNIMWDTISAILKEEMIKAPVNEYRGMTYVKEMVENFQKIFNIPYGTYNIGSENELSRYDVVKLIIEELGLSNKLNSLLEKDTEKITNEGIIFSTTEEGIKKCIREELLRGNIEKYRNMLKK